MSSHIRSALMISMMVPMMVAFGTLSGVAHAETKAPAAATRASEPVAPRKPLDLRPPHITQLYTSEQLNQILAATFIREDIEEVEVEGERGPRPSTTPNVWPGIAAPFWALLNPTQSWRIFAPLPPDQTDRLRFVRANATDSYVLEPAGVPSPHAQ